MTLNDISIDLDQLCQGKVIVDGKDISGNVLGLEISCESGHMPEVTLRCVAEELKVKLKGKVKLE